MTSERLPSKAGFKTAAKWLLAGLFTIWFAGACMTVPARTCLIFIAVVAIPAVTYLAWRVTAGDLEGRA